MMNQINSIVSKFSDISYQEIQKSLPKDFNEIDNVLVELEEIKKSFLDNIAIRDKKIFIHMAGLPGSGKTTYCKENILKEYDTEEIVYLGFDDVMEKISYYQIDKEINTTIAFSNWEIPARILGYEILAEAYEKGLSVILDNGGANPKHVEIINAFKESGYTTKMFYLNGKPEELIDRIKEREKVTKRAFPIERLGPRYESLLENINIYKNTVDEFVEVSNT
ncbi:zeta toxin family protein [Flammeovirga sp. SJP92]|uniref:zeta toxin family protein n=1 Tax=Flammeovirga sp. SJP92 TaxID=1775430 RepID=UPI0007897376|nr:zeta toxin family protein [Flammeovirga sp. SJP92]KXX71590.1 hypothetical protein AVL50_04775 [Flammeovirga sp. SJP92]